MTDYTMPVLSEQERDDLKKFILLSKDESAPNYSIEEIKRYMRLSMKIALAALNAEPVSGVIQMRGGVVMDGSVHLNSNSYRALTGLRKMKLMPVGTKFYTAPPVPVKQEGEQ